jgi:cyclophilin family peptidyl-prolyl cis-trans isomerase
VGTEKRERQKANRALRQQEIEKAESRRRGFRIAAIVIGGLVAVFGLVWIATVVTGDDDEATVTTEVVPDDTLAPAVSEPVSTEPVSSEPVSSEPVSTDQAAVDPVTTDPATTDAASTQECPPEEGRTEAVQQFDSAPPMCLDPAATYQAVVTTNMGEFTIDLDQDAAPLTVNNFVFLARNLYYDDTPCHRIITDFVVQCGDPTGTGTGGPGYEFADELPEAGAYEVGSIAMANSGPDTNGSQFFIITGEQGVALPPSYSLFGQVTDGLDTTVADLAATGSASGEPTEPVEIQSVRIVQS